MKHHSTEYSLGIELSDNALLFAKIENTSDGIQVAALQEVTIPTKTIINGEIINIETLTEIIAQTIEKNGWQNANVTLAFSDHGFFKKVDLLSKEQQLNPKREIENRLSSLYQFSSIDFQSGFQIPENDPENPAKFLPVCYAGMPTQKINGLKDFAEILNLNLTAIDITPLAIIRAINWNQQIKNQPYITFIIESNYIDITIHENETILLTRTIRKNISLLEEDPIAFEELTQKISLTLFSFKNTYPSIKKINTIIFFTKQQHLSWIITQLKDHFKDYNHIMYDPKQNLQYTEALSALEIPINDVLTYIPAIGLGIKYFEKLNKTLSLTKAKKQIDVLFGKKHVIASVFCIVIIILISLFVRSHIKISTNQLASNINQIQNKITLLQSGKTTKEQITIKKYKNKTKQLSHFRKQILKKAPLLALIKNSLQKNIHFDSLTMSTDVFKIKCKSASQPNIYRFHQTLKKHFADVSLKEIKQQTLKNEASLATFIIQFKAKKQ